MVFNRVRFPMQFLTPKKTYMKIVLTNKESEKLFLDAICNALGYIESGYDLELTFDDAAYEQAKVGGGCYEDILLRILKNGGSLTLVDHGYDGGEYTRTITIKDVHEKVAQTPLRHLMDAIEERGDVVTSDVIIQSVFYGEVIFG